MTPQGIVDASHLKSWVGTNQAITRRRRIVLPGFPVEPFVMRRDELRTYFSQPRICCLMCGKVFHALSPHLRCIHGMTEDEYRERYGMPYDRGLVGRLYHDKLVNAGDRLFQFHSPESVQRMHEANRRFGTRTPGFFRLELHARNLVLGERNKGKTKFTQADYDTVLRRINEQHMSLEAALVGVMSKPVWLKYRRRNPHLQVNGRVSSYTDEDFKRVLDRFEQGMSLQRAIEGIMSTAPINRWLKENPTVAKRVRSVMRERLRMHAAQNLEKINAA